MERGITRREALAVTAGATLGLGLMGATGRGAWAALRGSAPRAGARSRSLRFAHLTDIHVQPERKAFEGLTACLRHLHALADAPELVVTGGDLVMDAFESTFDRTRTQWDLFTRALKDSCGLPVEHCLGNHDIWGWNKAKSGTKGDEKGWGKAWAMELLGMPRRFRHFDRGGWRFIVLDSVHPDGSGYIGLIDGEQMEWLKATLDATPASTPVVVVSHVPIFSVSAMMFDQKKADERAISPSLMVSNARSVHRLLASKPNVKVCLSGHIHQLDRVEYEGVTYLCDGAVCGSWWKGRNEQCDEGYGVIDLFDDGTFAHQYVRYGWVAAANG
ncbi:MAG: metallophosphoesterase [Phycisphaerae bacterium]|nr:metallophosphoesterase [Phycisphaerae bacterium]